MRSIRRRAVVPFSLALGAALAGCAEPQRPLRLGAIPFVGYEFLFWARDQGLLDPRLRLHRMRSSADALQALSAGRLEAAALTLDEVITGLDMGLDLRIVLVLDVSAGADAILMRPPGPGEHPLRGRKVGLEGNTTGDLLLSAYLERLQLSPEAIRTVQIPLTQSHEAWQRGEVDVMVSAEPWASQIEREGGVRVFDSSDIPGRIVDVVAVRADRVDDYLPVLTALASAQFEALKRWQASPEVVAAAVAPRLELAPAQFVKAAQGLRLPDRAANVQMLRRDGEIATTLPQLGAWMQQHALLRQALNLDALLDARAVTLSTAS